MSTWSEYLLTQGAVVLGDRVDNFGDPVAERTALPSATVLADLSHFGLIGFSGDEALKFLHGQVTNDLRPLSPETAVFAGYCSAKGRMLANFLVFRQADDLLLMLPETLRAGIQKRLGMFVLRARVQVRDASAEWVRLGLAGPGAAALLAGLGLMPAGQLAVVHGESGFAVRIGTERFILLLRPDTAPTVWMTLRAMARPVGAAAWDWLAVNAGVPTILPETQDAFVPQMANMGQLNGLSLTKGCYPGQEIVARTEYLGQQKRRLYLAHVSADARPGDALYSPLFGEQSAGTVVNAAPSPGQGSDLLAVLQIRGVEHGEVHLGTPQGPALDFKPLPYPL